MFIGLRTKRTIVGRVETGKLKVGDSVQFLPNGQFSQIATIERWNAPPNATAEAGESIGITLKEEAFIERGQIMVLKENPAQIADIIEAREFFGWEKLLRFEMHLLSSNF